SLPPAAPARTPPRRLPPWMPGWRSPDRPLVTRLVGFEILGAEPLPFRGVGRGRRVALLERLVAAVVGGASREVGAVRRLGDPVHHRSVEQHCLGRAFEARD